jgi:hypothetical protein
MHGDSAVSVILVDAKLSCSSADAALLAATAGRNCRRLRQLISQPDPLRDLLIALQLLVSMPTPD